MLNSSPDTAQRRKTCLVIVPFGRNYPPAGMAVNFEAIYLQIIEPAIAAAGLEPLRADVQMSGSILYRELLERLMICDYVIIDITIADPAILYELGVRHASRRRTTVVLSHERSPALLDFGPLRSMVYRLDANGRPAAPSPNVSRLTVLLRDAQADATEADSPVFRLTRGRHEQTLPDDDADAVREGLQRAAAMQRRLAEARRQGVAALHDFERDLSEHSDQSLDLMIGLFLAYRSVSAWEPMIRLVDRMPSSLAMSAMVQEQRALALNRAGRGEEAEAVLLDLLERRGPSSETYGILGRIYKDRWEKAATSGNALLARSLLDKAIDAYLRGFEADWRDAYPGINAVTLMEFKDPPDPRREQLLPVVSYAVERRIAAEKPDYWDHATRLELAVLAGDERRAADALGDVLAAVRETWEPVTTARNLRLIREVRERRQQVAPWMKEIEEALGQRSAA